MSGSSLLPQRTLSPALWSLGHIYVARPRGPLVSAHREQPVGAGGLDSCSQPEGGVGELPTDGGGLGPR